MSMKRNYRDKENQIVKHGDLVWYSGIYMRSPIGEITNFKTIGKIINFKTIRTKSFSRGDFLKFQYCRIERANGTRYWEQLDDVTKLTPEEIMLYMLESN